MLKLECESTAIAYMWLQSTYFSTCRHQLAYISEYSAKQLLLAVSRVYLSTAFKSWTPGGRVFYVREMRRAALSIQQTKFSNLDLLTYRLLHLYFTRSHQASKSYRASAAFTDLYCFQVPKLETWFQEALFTV